MIPYGSDMTGDLRVIEDGADRQLRGRPPTPPWVWILVGLAAGIGFAVVFVTPSSTTPEPEAVDVTVVSIDPVLSPDQSIGIADAIPGFRDALVAVTRTGRQNLEHLLWPVAGNPIIRPLPVGAFGDSRFDVTGTWLAVSTRLPDSDGGVLSMGKPSSLAPLASDVTSFAWHDATSGLLAYTQEIDGVWALSVSKITRQAQIVATGEGVVWSGGKVAAWGDWGFAIQDDSGSIALLTADGELKSTASGQVLDSIPTGWIGIYDGDLKLLSAGGGLRSLDFNATSIGGVLAAAISPDGTQIAVLGGSGLKISAIVGDAPTAEFPFTASLSKVEWSSDSRFVVMPFLRGVVVVDTANGRTYEHLVNHTIVEASVIPLTR